MLFDCGLCDDTLGVFSSCFDMYTHYEQFSFIFWFFFIISKGLFFLKVHAAIKVFMDKYIHAL